MSALGFGPGMQRWVHILHEGTTARVAFNGWHTPTFPVQLGVFQGSPLSPLLFVLAAQPMVAHTRRIAAALQPRHLPSGDVQPVIHQLVDDTTIHAVTTADAQGLLTSSVDLHCIATGAKLQLGKTMGLGLGSASHLAGLDTGVASAAPHTCIRQLGILLQRDAEAAATQLYTGILQRLRARIARWSGFQLSLLDRSYADAGLYIRLSCHVCAASITASRAGLLSCLQCRRKRGDEASLWGQQTPTGVSTRTSNTR
jgi:hypothetical protein